MLKNIHFNKIWILLINIKDYRLKSTRKRSLRHGAGVYGAYGSFSVIVLTRPLTGRPVVELVTVVVVVHEQTLLEHPLLVDPEAEGRGADGANRGRREHAQGELRPAGVVAQVQRADQDQRNDAHQTGDSGGGHSGLFGLDSRRHDRADRQTGAPGVGDDGLGLPLPEPWAGFLRITDDALRRVANDQSERAFERLQDGRADRNGNRETSSKLRPSDVREWFIAKPCRPSSGHRYRAAVREIVILSTALLPFLPSSAHTLWLRLAFRSTRYGLCILLLFYLFFFFLPNDQRTVCYRRSAENGQKGDKNTVTRVPRRPSGGRRVASTCWAPADERTARSAIINKRSARRSVYSNNRRWSGTPGDPALKDFRYFFNVECANQ